MPTPASSVGNVAIPVPAGAPDAPVVDTTVAGLLGYLQYWAQFALNPKLATMTAPPIADACPTANCYPYNPSKLVQKFNTPALFVWWDGKSTFVPWTQVIDLRQRDITALYVFGRVKDPPELTIYSGLIGALDAAWQRAISRRAHPSYAPPGYRLGTALYIALGLHDLSYLGGQEGMLQELVTGSARAASQQTGVHRLGKGNANTIVSGYPSLKATFRVLEQVEPDQALDADVTPDLLISTSTTELGDLENALPVGGHVVPAPPYARRP
jgi:hypothetical protein